ncbi:MAG TPA: coenzyme F420-0:L-glutamate ligase [Acidimicrobiales bacterium]|nr:coenzyme F420-0:L-glutamate ligase [Acidimicrobiales bacterium]
MSPALQLLAVSGIPLVRSGDDLAGLILEALAGAELRLEDNDIVVVSSKVVSKSEGRLVDLRGISPSPTAEALARLTDKDPRLVEVALGESQEVVRARPGTLIVRHQLGYVSAMAGVDRSNIEGADDWALLLPEKPDASAEALRQRLELAGGVKLGVVITDSHGRAFRVGNVGVALGVAGLPAVVALEGVADLFGRPLTAASVYPLADLVASASLLVAGEADEAVPVVVVRGLAVRAGEAGSSGAGSLVRPPGMDMFGHPDRDYASS